MKKTIIMVPMSESEFAEYHRFKEEGEGLLSENRRLKADLDGVKNQLKLSDKKYSESIRELIRENDEIRSDYDFVADSMLEMSKQNEKLKETISNKEKANGILRKNLSDALMKNECIRLFGCYKDQENEIKELKRLISSKDEHINTLLVYLDEANSIVTRLQKERGGSPISQIFGADFDGDTYRLDIRIK